ncbi:hypothetical protein ACOJBO_14410 [Rhizobium beringeri]
MLVVGGDGGCGDRLVRRDLQLAPGVEHLGTRQIRHADLGVKRQHDFPEMNCEDLRFIEMGADKAQPMAAG